MEVHSSGWCCIDCSMLLANGETPVDLDGEATAAWLAEIDRRTDGLSVVHETGQWIGSSDCYCEHEDFSMSSCDVCGSRLGGSRDAVTFFTA